MDEPGLQFVRGKPLRGCLRRQGGMMRGWHRKYFVLNDKCLFCFAREDDSRFTHNYHLDDYRPVELPLSQDEPDKYLFELVAERNSVESVTLWAASDADRKEWMKGLVYNKYADKGGAIFGLPLEDAMKYEHKQGRTVPYIVEACVEHLKAFAMDAEGIFRLAGRAGMMKELRSQFETGQQPALESVDIHTVGALLKAYLRELPQSLVPPELYQRVMNCAMRYSEAGSEEKKTEEITFLSKLLREEIPYNNYATLAYLCEFLNCLAANSDKTKMDAHNLALVFGPNLIRHMDNSPELLMLTADLTQHLAYMLIHHYKEILPYCPPPAEPPALRPKALNTVATADLLRLSQPVECNHPSLLPPQSLSDLQGLNFSCNRDEVFTPGSCESPSSSPGSPFSFHSDHFQDSIKRRQAEFGDGSTSSESSSRADTLERNLGDGAKPVPPRRNKSRMKQRRSGGAPSSPSIDPDDVQKALTSAGHPLMSPPPPPAAADAPAETNGGSPGRARQHKTVGASPSIYVVVDDKGNINGEVDSQGKTVCTVSDDEPQEVVMLRRDACSERFCRAGGDSQAKLSPSRGNLEAQVVMLKSELVKTKTRSEELVKALKEQLTEMRSKYETRIATMEKQHQNLVLDLNTKLDAEKNSCAEAVERTVALQAQLYKYKMHYGELQEQFLQRT